LEKALPVVQKKTDSTSSLEDWNNMISMPSISLLWIRHQPLQPEKINYLRIMSIALIEPTLTRCARMMGVIISANDKTKSLQTRINLEFWGLLQGVFSPLF
jgi:hypothetical protein